MLLRPGVSYPELGGVVDGVRLSARGIQNDGQAQWYPTSRPTPRFIRMNLGARGVGFQWRQVPDDIGVQWEAVAALTASWASVVCGPWYLVDVDQPAVEGGWGDARWGIEVWGGESPGVRPELLIFQAVQMWRAAVGLPQVLDAPVINTQPGGDLVCLSWTPPGPSTPPALAGSVLATWTRSSAPAAVPYFLAVRARAALTIPAGEDLLSKDRWGGWVALEYGVPVCIDVPLVATGRMLKGSVIVAHVDVGEMGMAPFFSGQVVLRNAEPGPPWAGWGFDPWGYAPWGN